jgi:SWI/SNF-related matrix-associated actin-dependent regulator 1 of chromatin subfamily A
MQLYQYQADGAAWLAGGCRGLLADEPGLGKSAQAIRACRAIQAQTILVICPASLVQNWTREFHRFHPDFNGRLSVRSYDNVVRNGFEGDWDVLIADEAHFLKSRKAKRTQAVYGEKCDGVGGLIERARNVYLLTGTPAPNTPDEMWTHLRALFPQTIQNLKTRKTMNYYDFVTKYCRTTENYLGKLQIVGGKNLGDLKQRIQGIVLRRKKADVLPDLPPLTIDLLPVTGELRLPRECVPEQKMIDQVLATKGVEGLKDIANHVATLRRYTGLAKAVPLVNYVADQLEGGLDKIVIFAVHKEVIRILKDGLSDYGVAVIDGSTSGQARDALVQRFQNYPDVRVFIGQIQAAGTGLTLTAASQLIFAEASWVPSENAQAMCRIHRISQKNAAIVRFAMLANSIDESIQAACARKAADIREIFA